MKHEFGVILEELDSRLALIVELVQIVDERTTGKASREELDELKDRFDAVAMVAREHSGSLRQLGLRMNKVEASLL